MKTLRQLVILTLAHCSAPVFATSVQPLFYVGAELGIPFDSDQEDALSQMLVSRLGGSASVTDSTVVKLGRLFGGYKALEMMHVEVGLYQTGESTLRFTGLATRPAAFPYAGIVRSSAYGLNYTALFRPGIASGWNPLFLRLGGQWSRLESIQTTTTFAGTSSATSIHSGGGLVYGLGYDGSINKTLDWRMQLTRSHRIGGMPGLNTSVMSIGMVKKF